jgi:uncharacterized repeat protein (TIGR03803 family)
MKPIMIYVAFFAIFFLLVTSLQGQTFTNLYSFSGPDGSTPYAGLFRDSTGNLYGTTFYGGAYGFGTVFKLDTNNNETVLYSFAGGDRWRKSVWRADSRFGGQFLRHNLSGRQSRLPVWHGLQAEQQRQGNRALSLSGRD